jgi:ribosomal protein S27AE
MSGLERMTCPACGGAGGGPLGRAGSAWDNDEYVCPRCEGEGVVMVAHDALSQRPGIVKAAANAAEAAAAKRKATG